MRTILRNILKKQMGSNEIAEAWNKAQVKTYGKDGYDEIQRKNRRKK